MECPSLDAYESLPYDRLSVRETHPDHLAVLARLHGIESPEPGACRVLELGCASGANLIPMAWFLPGSRFLGLDLSAAQVDAGQAQIAALQLHNIEIRQADVGTADLGDEGFDYVIAHGLYSWVPAPVRVALLGLIRRHLNPGGVAYLSFNALPGWHMRGMLREMLLFHVRALVAAPQRLAAAREFLAFLDAGLGGLQALSAEYLRHELAALGQAPDSYLYHEYLAAVNEPVLFSDFVADAQRAGLRYLCNAELHYQFPAALGETAEQALAAFTDPLARQQYLDFLLNRNFHQALLVGDDSARPGELDYERFTRLALFADLSPPRKLELRKTKAQLFTDSAGERHAVSHPLTRAVLTRLSQVYPQALDYSVLESDAQRQVAETGDPRLAGQVEHLFGELFQLFALGAVSASCHAGGALPAPQMPACATPLALAEAAAGRLVDSRHASLRLDPLSALAVQSFDGRRDDQAITAVLRDAGASGVRVDPVALRRMLARRGALRS